MEKVEDCSKYNDTFAGLFGSFFNIHNSKRPHQKIFLSFYQESQHSIERGTSLTQGRLQKLIASSEEHESEHLTKNCQVSLLQQQFEWNSKQEQNGSIYQSKIRFQRTRVYVEFLSKKKIQR